MKTIETLSGSVNGAGSFTETFGPLNSVIWEHAEVPGHFILTSLGYGGLRFVHDSTVIAITFAELLALAKAKEPALLPMLPAVTAAPSSGVHPQTVALACSVGGVSIRYTTDGSTPTSGSTLYSAPLSIAAATTLKAIAFRADWQSSPLATFIYT